MSSDKLCVRTMHVAYTDADGQRQQRSVSGYDVSVFLPLSSVDVEVTFSVVGGRRVNKVDREQRHAPFVKDERGNYVPELFSYPQPPPFVQYHVSGTSLYSWVSEADERGSNETLFQMMSKDFIVLRTMHIKYTDGTGRRQQWSGTGYKVKCHLPSDVKDVEVTFSVVGGSTVRRVDRRDPELGWVKDANGQYPQEKFVYSSCPRFVVYELCGPPLGTYVSAVTEHSDGHELEGPEDARALADSDAAELFAVPLEEVPPIGGLVDLQQPHSEHLLPSEVALFEPTEEDKFQPGTGARLIFLNTPLTEAENKSLGELHSHLASKGIGGPTGEFPHYMAPHALRMLQTAKFNVSKAADLIKACTKERIQRLPIAEADVLDDLRSGFIYWHGRDRKCRPCAVIRLGRLGDMARDKERAVRLTIFVLEYALRYALAPGRVENWVIIIDLENLSNAISPMHIPSMLSTAHAIGLALEKVYCGRMAWLKIVNVPGGAWLSRSINNLIPAEKKDKISFPQDLKSDIGALFEPHQLEQRYGGSSPDTLPSEVYPFRFFPNCTGVEAPMVEANSLCDWANRNGGDVSLHSSATLDFHAGLLWDESSAERREAWLPEARTASLTTSSAEALSRLAGGEPATACSDLGCWLELVGRSQLGLRSVSRPETCSTEPPPRSSSGSSASELAVALAPQPPASRLVSL